MGRCGNFWPRVLTQEATPIAALSAVTTHSRVHKEGGDLYGFRCRGLLVHLTKAPKSSINVCCWKAPSSD